MPLITITSGIGCEEMTIARLVADALKLDLYDDQRLQEKAIESEGRLLEVVKGVQGVAEVKSEIVVPDVPDIG